MENKVLDKIRKLLALANDKGASPAEVENALAQAEKLQRKYNISLDEFELSPHDITYEYLYNDTKSYEPSSWLQYLAQIIAEGYNCVLINHKTIDGKKFIRIVGTANDVQLCENVIFSTKEIIRSMAQVQWKMNGKTKTFRKSYILGFLNGLNERLQKERAEQQGGEKYALIIHKKDALIKDFINANWNVRQGRAKSMGINDVGAYHKGIEDGKRRNYNHKALC